MLTTVPTGLPPERCPEPKTCRRYGFIAGESRRWKADGDGRVTIRYAINPSGSTTLTPEKIEGAMKAAAETWERAAPALRFVYLGRTTQPAVNRDGVSVIDFNGATAEHTWTALDSSGHVAEFDISFSPGGWVWAPCRQADNSCTPYRETTYRGAGASTYSTDVQSVATHAFGHALWLVDMVDNDLDRELTMYPGDGEDLQGSRHWSTLALGDVLGIRSLYPCSCPLPPIYEP